MITAELKRGVGKKSGNEYYAIEIDITPTYKKVVYLDDCETALVKMVYEI